MDCIWNRCALTRSWNRRSSRTKPWRMVFCVFSHWKHEIKTLHKEYTLGAALMLCNFSFMLSALAGIYWHHHQLDLCCETLGCGCYCCRHIPSHVSFYSLSALNGDSGENCSHSTHVSSLTIHLTPFTVMQPVKGLIPNSFYSSLLFFILLYSLSIADWIVLLQGIRNAC